MKYLRLFPPLFLLIVLFVLLLSGCKGIIPSPGATDDLTISGTIKMPFTCCTIDEPIYEEATGHYTDSWSIIPNAIVKLKDAENCEIIDTTESNEIGYYVFDNVEPGLYVITAYCPIDDEYLLKDVAEKAAGVGLNAGIPDCDSTALALVIEELNDCFENYLCFEKDSTIHTLVQEIAKDIGEVNIPLIIAHEDFGSLNDVDYNDLVDLVCDQLKGCCLGTGATPGPAPGPTPGPTNYTLTLLVSPEGAGTVTGAGTYSINTTVNISASTNAGWQFVNWTGDASGTNTATSIVMNGNKTATANFEQIPHTITYHANGGTGSQTDSSSPYYAGATVTVLGQGSITRTGYTFNGWNTESEGNGESYAADDTFPMPAANVVLYAQWIPILFQGGTATIAFEDLRLSDSSMDFDYNDWVVDLGISTVFEDDTPNLSSVTFNITPKARGAGYDHSFHIKIPAGTFAVNGNYILNISGDSGSGSGVFNSGSNMDFVVIPDTRASLGGETHNHTNTLEGEGPIDPSVTATLTITFNTPFYHDFSGYDPYSADSMHGEGLFFDPYITVDPTIGSNYTVGTTDSDPRVLTVPVEWKWPEEGVHIGNVYSGVTTDNPPSFSPDWWEGPYNNCVYGDGVPCP